MKKSFKCILVASSAAVLAVGAIVGVSLSKNNSDVDINEAKALSSFKKSRDGKVPNDATVISKTFVDYNEINDKTYLRYSVAVNVTYVDKITMKRTGAGVEDNTEVFTYVYRGIQTREGGMYYNSSTGELTGDKTSSDDSYYFACYSIEITKASRATDFTVASYATGVDGARYDSVSVTTSYDKQSNDTVDGQYEALGISSLVGLNDEGKAAAILKAADVVERYKGLSAAGKATVSHAQEIEKIMGFGSVVYDGHLTPISKNPSKVTMSIETIKDSTYGNVYKLNYFNHDYATENIGTEYEGLHFLNVLCSLDSLHEGDVIGTGATKLIFLMSNNVTNWEGDGCNLGKFSNSSHNDGLLASTNLTADGAWGAIKYDLGDSGLTVNDLYYQMHETWGGAKESGNVLFTPLVALNPLSEEEQIAEVINAIEDLPEASEILSDIDVLTNWESYHATLTAYNKLGDTAKDAVTNIGKFNELKSIYDNYSIANDTYVKNDGDSGRTLSTISESADKSHGKTFDITLRSGSGIENSVMGLKTSSSITYNNKQRMFVYVYNPGNDYGLGFRPSFWGEDHTVVAPTMCAGNSWTKIEVWGSYSGTINFVGYSTWSTVSTFEGWKITPIYVAGINPAIIHVENIINALSDSSTEQEIVDARNAFEALSENEKSAFNSTILNKLIAQENRIFAGVQDVINAINDAKAADLSTDEGMMRAFAAVTGAKYKYNELSELGKSKVTNYSDLATVEQALNGEVEYMTKVDKMSYYGLDASALDVDASYGKVFKNIRGDVAEGFVNYLGNIAYNKFDNTTYGLYGFFAYNPTDNVINTYADDWGGKQFWNVNLTPNSWTFVPMDPSGMNEGKTAADMYLAYSGEGVVFTNVMGVKFSSKVETVKSAIEVARAADLTTIEGMMRAFTALNGAKTNYELLTASEKARVTNYSYIASIEAVINGRINYMDNVTKMSYYGEDASKPGDDSLYGKVFLNVRGEPGNNYLGGFNYSNLDNSTYCMYGFFAYNPTDSAVRTYASDWGSSNNFWDTQLAPKSWTFVAMNPDCMHAGKTAADSYLESSEEGFVFTKVIGLKKPGIAYNEFTTYQNYGLWTPADKTTDPIFGDVYQVKYHSDSTIMCTLVHNIDNVEDRYQSLYVYVYNPTNNDVFCYPADIKTWGNIGNGNTTLKAGEWTKVSIKKTTDFLSINQTVFYLIGSDLPTEGWLITPPYCGLTK